MINFINEGLIIGDDAIRFSEIIKKASLKEVTKDRNEKLELKSLHKKNSEIYMKLN